MRPWQKLHEAFDAARRVGHSWAAARGALQSGGVVICWTMEQARRLTEETNAEAISLNFIDSLRGRPRPMVVDNHVASMMAAELMRLESRLERDQGMIFELRQDKERLRSEVFYLESAVHMLGTIIEEAQFNGAFRALAEIGLAVAFGQLYTCAAAQVQFARNRYGNVSIATSVDAWFLQLAMRGCLP